MGIWTKIFGSSKPKTIQDEFFGKLVDEDGYFTGEKYFKPVNTSVELMLEGKEINAFQRNFFVELENRYASLLPIAKTAFEDKFKNWKPDFEIIDFEQEFTLTFIYIPDEKQGDWNLSFSCVHDLDHCFSIFFEDWVFISTLIDG